VIENRGQLRMFVGDAENIEVDRIKPEAERTQPQISQHGVASLARQRTHDAAGRGWEIDGLEALELNASRVPQDAVRLRSAADHLGGDLLETPRRAKLGRDGLRVGAPVMGRQLLQADEVSRRQGACTVDDHRQPVAEGDIPGGNSQHCGFNPSIETPRRTAR